MVAELVETRGRLYGWVMRMCQFGVMLFAVLVLTMTIISLASETEGRILGDRYLVEIVTIDSIIPGTAPATVRVFAYQANGGFPTATNVYRLVMCSLLLMAVFSQMYLAVLTSKKRFVKVYLAVFSLLFALYLGSWIWDIILLAQTTEECNSGSCTIDIPVEFVGTEFVCSCVNSLFTPVIVIGTTLVMVSTCLTVAVFVYVVAKGAASPMHPAYSGVKADNV